MPISSKAWKVRLLTAIFLVALAFLGLIITDVKKDGGWFYWRVIIPLFAGSSIFLSWHLRKDELGAKSKLLWQEVVHWLGLALAIFLISKLVNIGIMGRFEAGLVALTMLALTTFIAGIYTEKTFLLIGLLLGFISYGIAFLDQYLYAIMIPMIIIAAAIVFWIVYQHRPANKNQM